MGKVNFLHLYPLSFFEVLSAVGKERLRSHLESLEAFIPIAVPIHQQLARENKKIVYSALRKSARGRDYEESIAWLVAAGLLHKSTRIKKPGIPLSAYAEPHICKLFLLDTGLLAAQAGLSAKALIHGSQLFTEFKGALTENYVARE